jgi:hypothetical protein
MPSGLGFSCSPELLQQIQDLVDDDHVSADICGRYDVETLGAQRAVFRYLAQSQDQSSLEVQHSLNTLFVLFSGYMVFLMQAGFALVSLAPMKQATTAPSRMLTSDPATNCSKTE